MYYLYKIIKLGKPTFLMFNLYKDKFIFEMPWLIWQTKIWNFRSIQIRKHETFQAFWLYCSEWFSSSFFKAMSFETLLIYKWSKHILHYHQFQILNRDEIISWKASFREFAVVFPGGSEGKESACNVGDLGSIHGSGRSPWVGNGNPLQYSCLENSLDRGAW